MQGGACLVGGQWLAVSLRRAYIMGVRCEWERWGVFVIPLEGFVGPPCAVLLHSRPWLRCSKEGFKLVGST